MSITDATINRLYAMADSLLSSDATPTTSRLLRLYHIFRRYSLPAPIDLIAALTAGGVMLRGGADGRE